jgi:hypothetical protein
VVAGAGFRVGWLSGIDGRTSFASAGGFIIGFVVGAFDGVAGVAGAASL